jgi:hypothetical protein
MRILRLNGAAALAAATLLIAACSTAAPTPTPNGGGGSNVVGGSQPPAASSGNGTGGGNGADAGTLNACNLLTTAEIQAAVGWAVKDGVLQQSDGQADCEWTAAADESSAVSVTVANYNDFLWQSGANAAKSTAVSGIGDAAFKGWPTFVALNIKVKGYAVTIGVVDFKIANDKVDAEDLALAKLVLPRL